MKKERFLAPTTVNKHFSNLLHGYFIVIKIVFVPFLWYKTEINAKRGNSIARHSLSSVVYWNTVAISLKNSNCFAIIQHVTTWLFFWKHCTSSTRHRTIKSYMISRDQPPASSRVQIHLDDAISTAFCKNFYKISRFPRPAPPPTLYIKRI